MTRAVGWAAAVAVTGLVVVSSAGCSDTVSGVVPVGGNQPSEAKLERFARRLHLDLTGAVASEERLTAAVGEFVEAGNTPSARAALADELLTGEAYAAATVAELENRTFGGETLDGRYQFQCGLIRNNLPACAGCGPPADANACGNCACDPLAALDAERTRLLGAAADISAGAATTGDVERAFAESLVFRSTFGAPAALGAALFEAFLGRPPEGEELTNASRMVQGSLLGPQFPAGLLFLRHGHDYADLVDIVFDSEAYREAIVVRAFQRLLGRTPTADELVYFVARTDPVAPDSTGVVRAIVASRDYFEQ